MRTTSPATLASLASAVAIVAFAAGCTGGYGGGGGGYGGGGGGSGTPMNCSAAAPLVGPNYQVGLNLALSTCNDMTYGMVRGYTAGGASSQVITAPVNANIVFVNNDALYNHTADFLAGALPFPGMYGMGVTTARAASAAGTLIDQVAFSTGTLTPGGGTSLVYKVPAAPGTITLIGDFFYYSSGLRTVVIAQ